MQSIITFEGLVVHFCVFTGVLFNPSPLLNYQNISICYVPYINVTVLMGQ